MTVDLGPYEFAPPVERRRAYRRERDRLMRLGLWKPASRQPIEVRVLDRLDRKHGPVPDHAPELGRCWPWMGARTAEGYGVIRYRNQARYVHRLALEFALGRPLGTDMVACHRCDNKTCARPSHLYEGTVAENNQDIWDRIRKPALPGVYA